jgi:hypothetical protein
MNSRHFAVMKSRHFGHSASPNSRHFAVDEIAAFRAFRQSELAAFRGVRTRARLKRTEHLDFLYNRFLYTNRIQPHMPPTTRSRPRMPSPEPAPALCSPPRAPKKPRTRSPHLPVRAVARSLQAQFAAARDALPSARDALPSAAPAGGAAQGHNVLQQVALEL